MKRAEF